MLQLSMFVCLVSLSATKLPLTAIEMICSKEILACNLELQTVGCYRISMMAFTFTFFDMNADNWHINGTMNGTSLKLCYRYCLEFLHNNSTCFMLACVSYYCTRIYVGGNGATAQGRTGAIQCLQRWISKEKRSFLDF